MKEGIGLLDLDQRFAALDDEKAAFVSKVYLSLSGCMLVSTLACALVVSSQQVMNMVLANYSWLSWMPLVMLFGAMFVRGLLRGAAGWIFLLAFVSLMGLLLGPIIAFYTKTPAGTTTVGMALGLTAVIFLGLTAYVRITGANFSYLGGFLWMATIALFLTGIALMFFGGATAQYIYACVGAVLFSLWILYDTSAVTRAYYQANDVVGAVLKLYLDILNLFLFLLQILSGRSKD